MNNPQNNNPYPPQPYYLLPEEEGLDFKRYISLFISNWYWFAIALFIALSISYGINRWSPDVYTVSSTLLIKNDQSGNLTDIFPGSEGFQSQQNVVNEMGILRSFNLNYRVMQKLPEFWITYTSVGKRGIAETRMYKSSPFVVVFDSLGNQSRGQRIDIKILSENRYRIELNGWKNLETELSFGDRFNEA